MSDLVKCQCVIITGWLSLCGALPVCYWVTGWLPMLDLVNSQCVTDWVDISV